MTNKKSSTKASTKKENKPAQQPQPKVSLYQKLRSKAFKKNIMIHAMLELTNRCNTKCRHCYIDQSLNDGELTLDDYKKLIDELATFNVLYLTFSGGEILSRPDFFEIAEYARKKEFSLNLFTNGTLINESNIDRIAALCPERIEMSIYGGTAESHDYITKVPGSFDRMLHAITLLRERNIPVQLKATWMRVNWREKELIMKIVEDYDTSFRSGSMLIYCRDGDTKPTELLIPAEELQEMHREAFEKRPKEQQKLPAEPKIVPEEQRKQTYPCGVAHTSINIDSRGNIYPCAALRIQLGNIKTDRIADIWKDAPDLLKMRTVTLDHLDDCRECALWSRCNRCAGLAHQETGSYTAKSPQACEIAEATKKFYDEKKCEIE